MLCKTTLQTRLWRAQIGLPRFITNSNNCQKSPFVYSELSDLLDIFLDASVPFSTCQSHAAVVEEEGATAEQQWQMPQSVGDWRTVWADLNLTEEEQARLREGLRLAWERWQNMSEQERQAEIERLREMGERWENMSEEEKREASQRMRDRFEEWRKSDRVELPELSLD